MLHFILSFLIITIIKQNFGVSVLQRLMDTIFLNAELALSSSIFKDFLADKDMKKMGIRL